MARIHPTAHVDPQAELHDSVEIGPYCCIGDQVKIGRDTKVLSHVVIEGQTEVGEGCEIYPFAVLGTSPQDTGYADEPTTLRIGHKTIIREHVTLHRGTARGRGQTTVGDHCMLMVGAHVAHDCCVGNHVTMINNATLAGHVVLEDRVVMGGLSAIHQWVRIGTGAMIGGMTGVERDVIPYGLVMGDRARLGGLNSVGLKRQGVSKAHIQIIRRVYKTLFESGHPVSVALDQIDEADQQVPQVSAMLAFMRAESIRGLLTTPR